MRYEKTVDGQTINHVWDGSKQIIADVIDNQFYEADCYIRGTNLVAKYNYRNGNKSEYTYYTQNAYGDVVNLTDKDGKVTKKYTYDAFGVEKNIDENDTNAFRYCGEYFDAETGTIYLRARYYNPTTGRFISRDSFAGEIKDPLSLNLYTYCANNPILYVDPSGNSTTALVNVLEKIAKETTKAIGMALSDGPLPGVGDALAVTSIAYAIFDSGLLSKAYNAFDNAAQRYLASQKSVGRNSLEDIFFNDSTTDVPNLQDWYASWSDALPQTSAQEESLTVAKKKTTFLPPMKPLVFFPENPADFNPFGMHEYSYNNGKIIKWGYTEKIPIFEWDYDKKNGNHYHCMLPEWNGKHSEGGNKKNIIHYYPGTIMLEPWATWYRGY